MIIEKDKQIEFYKEELEYLELEVKETFETTSENLFSKGSLFFAKYLYHDHKRGMAHFELVRNNSGDIPRIKSNYLCLVLKESYKIKDYRKNHTYSDMLKGLNQDFDFSSCFLVDLYQDPKSQKLCCIINDITTTFLESLKDVIVAIGPDIPPFDYLLNLKKLSENINVES